MVAAVTATAFAVVTVTDEAGFVEFWVVLLEAGFVVFGAGTFTVRVALLAEGSSPEAWRMTLYVPYAVDWLTPMESVPEKGGSA